MHGVVNLTRRFYFSFQLFLKHNTLSVGAVLYAILFTKVVYSLFSFKVLKVVQNFIYVQIFVLFKILNCIGVYDGAVVETKHELGTCTFNLLYLSFFLSFFYIKVVQ